MGLMEQGWEKAQGKIGMIVTFQRRFRPGIEIIWVLFFRIHEDIPKVSSNFIIPPDLLPRRILPLIISLLRL